ncbi:hypothetical protein FPZ42_01230 [Mucilaginibacter achroorhodeus]|uniref:Uncharacterized protein n=1 Tax=Mucilaginibacter achroorhodeus TaxID=2599294 RepID=A0A563U950_9SPHI|nr:hypothetical protein [Mucilaginibacter achroorhodeus]TWR27864.1 hypothetical protein FPZ42_01230 [Mucilaginibacter achroorhodeus]
MLKKLLFTISFVSAIYCCKAQTAEEVYNKYLDYNLARMQGETEKALDLGADLIPNIDKLKPGARNNFYYSIANLYENNDQSVKAIEYYQKVVAAVPDYYVAQRGLGYQYAKQAEALKASGGAAYIAAVRKALPHLEKAQACDPDDDTLKLIKLYYNNINDKTGLATLNERLKKLSKTCVDLLDDKN